MKLQHKINYRFLGLLLMVFLLAGSVLYFVLGLVVSENIDEILEHRAERVKHSISNNQSVALISESPDQSIMIQPVGQNPIPTTYSDTLILDSSEKEYIYYRKTTFGVTSNNKNYQVTIVLSKLETEDLVELIFYFMLGLFALIVLVLFVLNRWLSASVWRPFYKTIGLLNTFKIDAKHHLDFGNTDVDEFKQLNQTLSTMVEKAQGDFKNLKEFTENASHEIQTPLAIIKSKLETVLQDKSLSDQRYEQIQTAYETVSRLSKLNEGLLLLSKIENLQFVEETEIDLCELIGQRLSFIEELIDLKKVKVTTSLNNPWVVKMNPYLAEILINNLLNNALKHNFEGGEITVSTSVGRITFSNTGKPLAIAPEKLFQRFVKQNAGSESTGLGLAIVSEICKLYNVSIQYEYRNGIHNISLTTLMNNE